MEDMLSNIVAESSTSMMVFIAFSYLTMTRLTRNDRNTPSALTKILQATPKKKDKGNYIRAITDREGKTRMENRKDGVM
jgi:hypothetical protein